jgi:hypothetical protein
MNDSFRLDLAGHDKGYIEDVLNGFLEEARSHGRKLLEIRVSRTMFDKLEFEHGATGGFFKSIPVMIVATPYEHTVEVIVGKSQ